MQQGPPPPAPRPLPPAPTVLLKHTRAGRRARRPARVCFKSTVGAGGNGRGAGGGGPCCMKKTVRLNGGNEIGRSVEKSLEEYFRRLDGEQPHGVYDMVIA